MSTTAFFDPAFDDFADASSRPRNNSASTKVAASISETYGAMLTVQDVATILQCTTKTVYKLCKVGQIPSVRIERRLYVPTVLLAEKLEGSMQGVSQDA